MNPAPGQELHHLLTTARALVLDFDGTLADTTTGHETALRSALSVHGVPLDSLWYRQHAGLSIYDLLNELSAGSQAPAEEIVQHSRTLLLRHLDTIAPIPCTAALLQSARRAGLPCAIASGAAGTLVHPALKVLGLTGEFTAVVVREDVPFGKPAPDLFSEAARRLGVPAPDCLAVDDSPAGVAAAQAAGMRTLTLTDGVLTQPIPTGPL